MRMASFRNNTERQNGPAELPRAFFYYRKAAAADEMKENKQEERV